MVVPGRQKFRAASFDSFGDHRIAMAFAVAALRAEGECTVKTPIPRQSRSRSSSRSYAKPAVPNKKSPLSSNNKSRCPNNKSMGWRGGRQSAGKPAY